MPSEPNPRSRERRRLSGITQERPGDRRPARELLPPAPDAEADEPLTIPLPFEEISLPPIQASSEEMREAAEAMMRNRRRAGTSLDELIAPSPFAISPRLKLILVGAAGIFAAGLGGYFLGLSSRNPAAPLTVGTPRRSPVFLSEPVVAAEEIARIAGDAEPEIAAAFALSKARQFVLAQERFRALAERFPQASAFPLEVARCQYFQGEFLQAQRTLTPLFEAGRGVSEAHFILGLVQLAEKNFEQSSASFRRCAEASPTRADAHFMWAEALRREGRPAEAAARFQAAYDRNQFETNEITYQLKLWLAQISAGTLPAEVQTRIEMALKAPPVPGDILIAEAGRAIKANDFARAARQLAEAKRSMEPLIFLVALQDATFTEEAWRPELAGFYKR